MRQDRLRTLRDLYFFKVRGRFGTTMARMGTFHMAYMRDLMSQPGPTRGQERGSMPIMISDFRFVT